MTSNQLRSAAEGAFRYPPEHLRKHGPRGYVDYQAYKPWLRDEFWFRCVYCLTRERWTPNGQDDFGVDHIIPQSAAQPGIDEYGNLVYACSSCNRNRQDAALPFHPTEHGLDQHLRIQPTGRVEHLSGDGGKIIDLCNLNRPSLIAFRRGMIRLLGTLVETGSPQHESILLDVLSLPESLPDLSTLRPPGGNTRPGGTSASAASRRSTGETLDVY